MSSIEFTSVTHRYHATVALDNVSIAFADDVVTAVVGRSGSGKSTLLQCINGLVRPAAGDVRVFGDAIDYQRLVALRRRIGYAVQGVGLFPHMTVRQNITLLARVAGASDASMGARSDELMALVELPADYRTRYPHELSGGEQQRVGLCRAMMLDPPIMLLDEPFGALDSITKSEVHGEFLRVQQLAPRTVVLVTHDLREAVRLAQRLVVIEGGRIVQHDALEMVLEHPATDEIAGLIASQLGGRTA